LHEKNVLLNWPTGYRRKMVRQGDRLQRQEWRGLDFDEVDHSNTSFNEGKYWKGH
jgi:hypothetical protein